MTRHIPAEVFPPGEFIRDELEARGWTQADLAFILDRPLQTVNEIIGGRKAITPETARGLAEAFGTSAEFWMNLESAYRLAQASPSGGVASRAKMYSVAPVKEMVKRGWIADAGDAHLIEGELLRFFEVKTLEDASNLTVAARMGTHYGQVSPPQLAWFARARKLARAVSAAAFERAAFARRLPGLRQLIASEPDVRRVPRVLADMGIRLVLVEHLPRTRIDGAVIWLDEATPAVALSLRLDRIDNFWFTLFHEVMHVKHGDQWSLDDGLVGEDAVPTDQKPDYEQRADREAAELLIPTEEIEGFIKRTRPLYSKKKIVQFANRIQVHPGIIVGQLQRRKEIPYSHNREMLTKVRSAVRDACLSDGWGDVPPVK